MENYEEIGELLDHHDHSLRKVIQFLEEVKTEPELYLGDLIAITGIKSYGGDCIEDLIYEAKVLQCDLARLNSDERKALFKTHQKLVLEAKSVNVIQSAPGTESVVAITHRRYYSHVEIQFDGDYYHAVGINQN